MIGVLICHAEWDGRRHASLARLRAQLPDADVQRSREPEHASQWALRAWRWVATMERPFAILNDDVVTHPHFLDACEAIAALGDLGCVSLHTQHPGALDGARKEVRGTLGVIGTTRGDRWISCYWYTGPAVLMWPSYARDLLAWCDKAPREFLEAHNEDRVAMQYAWSIQRPMLGCLPALVAHDTTVPSTLGYDNHPNRKASVPWCDADDVTVWPDPEYGGARTVAGKAAFLENPWCSTVELARVHKLLQSGEPLCTFCGLQRGDIRKPNHRVALCYTCVAQMVGASMKTLAGMG